MLISRAQLRVKPEGYSENHHILPKCIGGLDKPENLTRLTAEEHYVAHQLLVKIHYGHAGLVYAAMMMGTCSERHQRSRNKMYSWLRKRYSECMKNAKRKPMSEEQKKLLSEIRKTIVGWKHTEETKRKIGEAQVGSKNHAYGKTKSEAEKKHLSDKLKGVPKSIETRQRMSASLIGNKRSLGKKKPHSEETKLKLRIALQNYYKARRNENLGV